MSMYSKVVSVSPELAKKWLGVNIDNRLLREPAVKRYARMMKKGEWPLTHQGIAFDEDGNLLDGQHRLYAIILAGVSVNIFVIYNAPRSSFAYLDVPGNARSISDRLNESPRHGEVVSLAARLMFNPVTPTDEIAVNEIIGATVEVLLNYCGTACRFFSSRPVKLAAVCQLMDGADKEYVLETYRNLCRADYNKLAAAPNAFVQQHVKGKINAANTYEVLARAKVAFDPAKRNVSRVLVNDTGLAAAWVRSVITGHGMKLAA